MLAGLDAKVGLRAIVVGGTPADLTVWPNSKLVKDYLGYREKERPDLWRAASPVNAVTDNSPPVFMYHGDWDMLVESAQVERLENILRQKKRPCEIYKVAFMGHFMTYLFSQSSINHGIDFIKKQL